MSSSLSTPPSQQHRQSHPGSIKVVYVPNALHNHDFAQFKTHCAQLFNHLVQLRESYNIYATCLSIVNNSTPNRTPELISYANNNIYRFMAQCQYHLACTQKFIHVGMNPFFSKLYQEKVQNAPQDVLLEELKSFKMDLNYFPTTALSTKPNDSPPKTTLSTTTSTIAATPTTTTPTTTMTTAQGTPKFNFIQYSGQVKPVPLAFLHEIVGLYDNSYATTRFYLNKSRDDVTKGKLPKNGKKVQPQDPSPLLKTSFEGQLIFSATNINTQVNAYLYPTHSTQAPQAVETTPHRHLVGVNNISSSPQPQQQHQSLPIQFTHPLPGNQKVSTKSNQIIRRKVKLGTPFGAGNSAMKDLREVNPLLFPQQPPTQTPPNPLTTSTSGPTPSSESHSHITSTSQSRADVKKMRFPSSLTPTQAAVLLSDLLQKHPEWSQKLYSNSKQLQAVMTSLVTAYTTTVQHSNTVSMINRANATGDHRGLEELPFYQQFMTSLNLPLTHFTDGTTHSLIPQIPTPPFPQFNLVSPPITDQSVFSQQEMINIITAIQQHPRLNHYSAISQGATQIPLAPHFQLLLFTILTMSPWSEIGKKTILNLTDGRSGINNQLQTQNSNGWHYVTQTHFNSTLEKFKKVLGFTSYSDPASTLLLTTDGQSYNFHNGLTSREIVWYFKTLPSFLQTYFSTLHYQLNPQNPNQPIFVDSNGQSSSQEQDHTTTPMTLKSFYYFVNKYSLHTSGTALISNISEALYSWKSLPSLAQYVSVMLQHLKKSSLEQRLSTNTSFLSPLSPSSLLPTIHTQGEYFEHLQYIYQRLVTMFCSILHLSSLLYSSMLTSCDIILLTKTVNYSVPVINTYNQYNIPFVSLLTMMYGDDKIEIFFKLFKSTFNLPLVLLSYQEYLHIVSKNTQKMSKLTNDTTDQVHDIDNTTDYDATSIIIPLFHDSTTRSIICYHAPFAPSTHTIFPSHPTGQSNWGYNPTPFLLPAIDIIGINIIVPTAYQLFIPLHYSPFILASPVIPVVPSLPSQHATTPLAQFNSPGLSAIKTPNKPQIEPWLKVGLNHKIQHPLFFTPKPMAKGPTKHNFTQLAPKSIHFSTIIDLSSRSTLIPPSHTSLPTFGSIHPGFKGFKVPPRIPSTTIPLLLPYTSNLIQHLQGSISSPSYTQSITTALPITNPTTTSTLSQSLSLPPFFKSIQTAVETTYYTFSSSIPVNINTTVESGSVTNVETSMGYFYREFEAYFNRIYKFQQNLHKRRMIHYHSLAQQYNIDVESYNKTFQSYQQYEQRFRNENPGSNCPHAPPPTLPISPQPPCQFPSQFPSHYVSLWELATNVITHSNMSNLIPYIVLTMANCGSLLHPTATNNNFDPTGFSSPYSFVPHVADPGNNPLWNTGIDPHITHLNVSLTTLMRVRNRKDKGINRLNKSTKNLIKSEVFVSIKNAAPRVITQLPQDHLNKSNIPQTQSSQQPSSSSQQPPTSQHQQHLPPQHLPPHQPQNNNNNRINSATKHRTINQRPSIIHPVLLTTPQISKRLSQLSFEPKAMPFMARKNPLTTATTTPLYKIDSLPPLMSSENQVPDAKTQARNAMVSNRIVLGLTPTPSSRRQPIIVTKPSYREWDYTPHYLEAYSDRNTGEVTHHDRIIAVQQFASLFIPAGLVHGAIGRDAQNSRPSHPDPIRDKPMWYHLFDSTIELYSNNHSDSTRYREWLASCKPKFM